MKKLYTLIAISIASVMSFGQSGQLPNGGFENWTVDTIYDFPTQWKNSNLKNYSPEPTIVESSDAQDGAKSCELRSLGLDPYGDDYISRVFQGSFAAFGIPYTDTFNEIRLHYKCDISTDDSLYMAMYRFVGGGQVDMQFKAVAGGVHNDWTEITIPVPAIGQDEFSIAFIMGTYLFQQYPDSGSWARIDNVKLYNDTEEQTNIPDFSFEDWTPQILEKPDNWYTRNEILVGFDQENAAKTTDAYSGTYAIELTNTFDPSYYTYSGSVSNYDINNDEYMIPYVATPTVFSGAYNYVPAPGSTDHGRIWLTFWRNGWNVVCSVEIEMEETIGYQTFSQALTFTDIPDSMSLIALAGYSSGSVLKVDDLSLSGSHAGLGELTADQTTVYPNPAVGKVTISAKGNYSWQLINPLGEVITSATNVNGDQGISVGDLPSGIYFVRLDQAGSTTMHQLIVQ
jgi:hypothetical protein